MPVRLAVRAVPAVAAALLAAGLSGCAGSPPEATATSAAAAPSGDPEDAWPSLAAHAALALDHHFAALYHYQVPGEAPRNLVATVARDGSWRVDIARAMVGGTTDVAIVSLTTGVYQCALSSAANPINPTCVRVAGPGNRVPSAADPRIERVFRQWLRVFTDRQSALSVALAQPLAGSPGTCYSIDGIAASMNPPADIGIYCYDEQGLLTAARVAAGTIILAGTPVDPPATVALPGQLVDRAPLGVTAPPAPPAPSPEESAASVSP